MRDFSSFDKMLAHLKLQTCFVLHLFAFVTLFDCQVIELESFCDSFVTTRNIFRFFLFAHRKIVAYKFHGYYILLEILYFKPVNIMQ